MLREISSIRRETREGEGHTKIERGRRDTYTKIERERMERHIHKDRERG